jgi:hypothetical protein
MSGIAAGTKPAAVISTVLVLPFVILELVNRREFYEGFPVVLFGLLWLLSMMFIVILTPIVQNVRSGNSILSNRIDLLIRGFLRSSGYKARSLDNAPSLLQLQVNGLCF